MNSHDFTQLEKLTNMPTIDWHKIENLIEEGADLTTNNSFKPSLLWQAFCADQHEIIFALLNRNINIHIISGYDVTTDVHRITIILNLINNNLKI